MGCYDEYEGIQHKGGDCVMAYFQIGDKVNMPNGLYIGYYGFIAIYGGKLVATYDKIESHYGSALSAENLMEVLESYCE